jgi:hypothetical protein
MAATCGFPICCKGKVIILSIGQFPTIARQVVTALTLTPVTRKNTLTNCDHQGLSGAG